MTIQCHAAPVAQPVNIYIFSFVKKLCKDWLGGLANSNFKMYHVYNMCFKMYYGNFDCFVQNNNIPKLTHIISR